MDALLWCLGAALLVALVLIVLQARAMNKLENDRSIMSSKTAALYLKVTPSTVRRWAKTGKLQGYCLGREYYFRMSDIMALSR